ncbi:MAG: 6-carboxytetrahydropterin synthase [Terriglobia bacterium]|jgi:6-pyruvoyltetrahydropterin/6-carboxytetrahydropterin synthase
MIYVTRRAEFSASHYYHNPDFSPEENRRIFGKCNNPLGHGHNYTVEVTVGGPIDPTTGMVLDLKELKALLEQEVIQAWDHKFLNKEVPAFASKNPTTENLAVEIWNLLAPKLALGKLHRIRVYETPDLFADYYGE